MMKTEGYGFGYCKFQSFFGDAPDLQPLTTPVGSLVYYWIFFGYHWPPLENRVNMDICNNGPFVIASYSDLSTSKEDVVLAPRPRSHGRTT
ncbi:hypothetical protein Nepgr_021239 [Nepenthes gracilis]|uniref:Uncharacterized protein n=1 Tax=Nepenthes gracilis TaxID=150966 RepID=A0AAD3SWH0_NEPGR|nr:hypothetical protein Nepgr_021239 [Nepenthes gracilis]